MLGGAAAPTIHDHVSALRGSSPLWRGLSQLATTAHPRRLVTQHCYADTCKGCRICFNKLDQRHCNLQAGLFALLNENKARAFPLAFAELSQALPNLIDFARSFICVTASVAILWRHRATAYRKRQAGISECGKNKAVIRTTAQVEAKII